MGKWKDTNLLAYQLKDILEMHFSQDETQIQSTVGQILKLIQSSRSCGEVRHFFGFGLQDAAVLIRDSGVESLNQVLILDRHNQSMEIFKKKK